MSWWHAWQSAAIIVGDGGIGVGVFVGTVVGVSVAVGGTGVEVFVGAVVGVGISVGVGGIGDEVFVGTVVGISVAVGLLLVVEQEAKTIPNMSSRETVIIPLVFDILTQNP